MNDNKALAQGPVLYEELVQQFKQCGVSKGQTLSVHASLSKIGWVMGGAETVIRALIEVIGPEGTLMMPAQTWKNLDPQIGVHWDVPESWWPQIRQHWPAYDKFITPSIGMGVIAEMFRTWPGTLRSDHPARSFCARGKNAAYLVENHDLENIFGEGSPLSKLYELDGHILLLGVGHNKNTSLHLAETRSSFTGKKTSVESSALLINGQRQWVSYQTLAVEDEDFVRLGEEYDRQAGVTVHKVGSAEVRMIRQRPLVDWAVDWMQTNRK